MRAPMVKNRRSFFCRGHSPKKVPPLLLQPPTLNLPLNRPASPPDDPQVESLRPGSPRPGPFFAQYSPGVAPILTAGALGGSRFHTSLIVQYHSGRVFSPLPGGPRYASADSGVIARSAGEDRVCGTPWIHTFEIHKETSSNGVIRPMRREGCRPLVGGARRPAAAGGVGVCEHRHQPP